MTAPQVGHLPFTALRPFFMVSSTPSAMGFFALQRTQYPSAITFPVAVGRGPNIQLNLDGKLGSRRNRCQLNLRHRPHK